MFVRGLSTQVREGLYQSWGRHTTGSTLWETFPPEERIGVGGSSGRSRSTAFPDYRVVDNPMKRYNLSSQSPLKKNADGSLSIWLASSAPEGFQRQTGCRLLQW
jgi:Protein of unknown function (DUF1214)